MCVRRCSYRRKPTQELSRRVAAKQSKYTQLESLDDRDVGYLELVFNNCCSVGPTRCFTDRFSNILAVVI